MIVIDRTYFNLGELQIPNNKNKNVEPTTTPTVQTTLDLLMDEYERELLLNALGVDLFNQLVVAAADIDNAIYAKWKSLINGADYTINAKKYRFDGLKGYLNQSLIAFYVKAKYLVNDEFKYTASGMSANTPKNGVRASFNEEYVSVWMKFIRQYQGSVKTINSGDTIYSGNYYRDPIYSGYRFLGIDYYTKRDIKSSLFQYLCDANELDSTAFPNFEFKIYPTVNRFGI